MHLTMSKHVDSLQQQVIWAEMSMREVLQSAAIKEDRLYEQMTIRDSQCIPVFIKPPVLRRRQTYKYSE